MHNLGHSRSTRQPTYLFHTPDAFVRTPLPGVSGGSAIVHASPQIGAAFFQYTLELDAGGSLAPTPRQRLIFALEGESDLTLEAETATEGAHVTHTLRPGSFAWLRPNERANLHASVASRLAVIEKAYEPLASTPVPASFIGHEDDLVPGPINGDPDLAVRELLPSGPAFDCAVNTMTYAPGAALAQVEVHYMEHGLLMLQGGGIYRLGDDWHSVTAGDFIWMAPYCPQWFGALGKTPAKYLIYKNFNRNPHP